MTKGYNINMFPYLFGFNHEEPNYIIKLIIFSANTCVCTLNMLNLCLNK